VLHGSQRCRHLASQIFFYLQKAFNNSTIRNVMAQNEIVVCLPRTTNCGTQRQAAWRTTCDESFWFWFLRHG